MTTYRRHLINHFVLLSPVVIPYFPIASVAILVCCRPKRRTQAYLGPTYAPTPRSYMETLSLFETFRQIPAIPRQHSQDKDGISLIGGTEKEPHQLTTRRIAREHGHG